MFAGDLIWTADDNNDKIPSHVPSNGSETYLDIDFIRLNITLNAVYLFLTCSQKKRSKLQMGRFV